MGERNVQIPQLYRHKEECCGCSACYSICPRHAITMITDEEGFLYPRIQESQCVGCLLCLSACAFKDDQRKKGFI